MLFSDLQTRTLSFEGIFCTYSVSVDKLFLGVFEFQNYPPTNLHTNAGKVYKACFSVNTTELDKLSIFLQTYFESIQIFYWQKLVTYEPAVLCFCNTNGCLWKTFLSLFPFSCFDFGGLRISIDREICPLWNNSLFPDGTVTLWHANVVFGKYD